MKFSEFLTLFKQGKVGARSHMKNLLEMALVDGHFDDTEMDLLKSIAKRNNISESQLKEIQANMEGIEFEVPQDDDMKFSQLYDLVKMMTIDEYIDQEESKLSVIFAKKFGYDAAQAEEIVTSIAGMIQSGLDFKETKKRVNNLFV